MYIHNKKLRQNKLKNNTAKLVASVSFLTLSAFAMPISSTFAKSSPISNTVPTLSGPCAYEWITDNGHVLYPLTNDKYPGVVSVDMIWGANEAPKVTSVCLDTGWGVESKQVTDGVQLRFNYNGVKAIDFKFVLGKTDIRNY